MKISAVRQFVVRPRRSFPLRGDDYRCDYGSGGATATDAEVWAVLYDEDGRGVARVRFEPHVMCCPSHMGTDVPMTPLPPEVEALPEAEIVRSGRYPGEGFQYWPSIRLADEELARCAGDAGGAPGWYLEKMARPDGTPIQVLAA